MLPDFHPIAVHFPVAFLTVYAVCELVILHPRVRVISWWRPMIKFLLAVGAGGTVGAFATGKLLEWRLVGDAGTLMVTHGTYGLITMVLSLAAAAAYWVPPVHTRVPTWVFPVIAACLLTVTTVTGILGGAIAYGTEADPIMSAIYKFLGGK